MAHEQRTKWLPQLQMHSQQQSRLFDLPPELRNCIYEMVFAAETRSVDVIVPVTRCLTHRGRGHLCFIDLPDFDYHPEAMPPSTALLRSCQRAYQECRDLFKPAQQASWNNREFVLNLHSADHLAKYVMRIPDNYLDRIRSFTFLLRGPPHRINGTLDWSEGEWTLKYNRRSGNRSEKRIIRQPYQRAFSVYLDKTDIQGAIRALQSFQTSMLKTFP